MRKLTKVEELKTPCKLFNIVDYKNVNGVRAPVYQEAKDYLFFANIKSFGGTERVVDGRISYIDTIEVRCNYRPDIKINSRIELLDTNEVYEIINKPDNINRSNKELIFKCEAVVKQIG